MKKNGLLICSIFFLLVTQSVNAGGNKNAKGWEAGVARVVITPEESMWMAGYASRNHASEGKLHDLWAKALVLKDADGKRSVLITLDLCAIPKDMSDNIRSQLSSKYQLSKAQTIINCSHTHSGPVIANSLTNLYPLDADQLQKVNSYTQKLIKQIVTLVGDAIKALQPADVFTENGFARFQVNRHTNNEAFLLIQPELKGPNDYAVPVIKITNKSGSIVAIAFGYACHNTVLNGYQWAGDYAGFAQAELESMYPGAVAMFFQGAGADQNPLPRRTVPLAKQYGKELAFAVENVVSKKMNQQPPYLAFSYSEVQLPLNPAATKNELEAIIKDTAVAPFLKNSAANMLNQQNKGKAPIKSYPYPVQAWKIGNQPLFALGGELVIEYAIEIKKLFGLNAFVLGYSNDIMAYIPSVTMLREANDKTSDYAFYDPRNKAAYTYEGELYTQLEYGLPSTWASSIESVILSEVQKMAKKAGVPLTEYK
ncbi:MAG: neutral/alkaline non-lysosomal ceramidase N-terminal domain-containing protein [Bacteroidetes bacterium]|nr:neutral/alkaline non-lysosomal ceramidase N-terminal domain-containing protein [Bacteroidota bacterium]